MATNVSRRNFLKTAALGGGLLASGAMLAACGGAAPAPAPAPAPAAGGGQAVTLDIASVGDELKFDKEALEAPAGSKLTLNLKNNSQPSANLLHNWTLAKPGTQEQVATDGITAGEANSYIKPNDPNVLAHTNMIKGGETTSITFDAPAPGQYPYLCTFPGHGTLMKGTLTIK